MGLKIYFWDFKWVLIFCLCLPKSILLYSHKNILFSLYVLPYNLNIEKEILRFYSTTVYSWQNVVSYQIFSLSSKHIPLFFRRWINILRLLTNNVNTGIFFPVSQTLDKHFVTYDSELWPGSNIRGSGHTINGSWIYVK